MGGMEMNGAMNGIDQWILTLILLTPLAGALVIALLPDRGKLPAWLALVTALVTFGLTLHLPWHFITGRPGFQFELDVPWITNPAIHYHVGVDGLSLWLVVLTGLLAPVGVLASWNAIQTRGKLFYSLFLVQQTAMAGVFVALDLMLYYGFWELSLVPMAVLIAMYGRKDGAKAATKFFLFTFIPSAPLLVAILWLYARTGTFSFAELQAQIVGGSLPAGVLFWVALAFLFAFAVKVPIFPLHGWLADSFSEAPVAMAMVIAGKLGLYSMLRFHVGLFPAQATYIAPVLIALTVIGILYGACLALVQRDFWRLIAFATLSHFSLTTLGIYGLTLTGRDGAVYQTLNQGVMEGALFVLLGVLDTRYANSQIAAYGGAAAKLPRTAAFFVITSLAMIGLPMLNGFIGEFLILSSTFTAVSKGWAIAATVSVILGSAYALWLVQRLFYGPESSMTAEKPVADLRWNEWVALVPLAVLMLVMGIVPSLWLPEIEGSQKPASAQQAAAPNCLLAPCRMILTSIPHSKEAAQ
jgi:NADH-quinone oxidoreductase subunit M